MRPTARGREDVTVLGEGALRQEDAARGAERRGVAAGGAAGVCRGRGRTLRPRGLPGCRGRRRTICRLVPEPLPRVRSLLFTCRSAVKREVGTGPEIHQQNGARTEELKHGDSGRDGGPAHLLRAPAPTGQQSSPNLKADFAQRAPDRKMKATD